MQQAIAHVALVVRNYDEATEIYVGKLGFRLVDDTFLSEHGKRWVVAARRSMGLTRAAKRQNLAATLR